MLFVLIGLLLVASVSVLLMKKNRESLYLLGMCCSLMVQFTGILIFIAKKGGYSKEHSSRFLFFSQPGCAMKAAVPVYHVGYARLCHRGGAVSVPVVPDGARAAIFHASRFCGQAAAPISTTGSLVLPDGCRWACYCPAAVPRRSSRRWPWAHNALVQGCYCWIIAYVAAALLLLLQELFRHHHAAFAGGSSPASWSVPGGPERAVPALLRAGSRAGLPAFTATTMSGTRASATCNTRRPSAGYTMIVVVSTSSAARSACSA